MLQKFLSSLNWSAGGVQPQATHPPALQHTSEAPQALRNQARRGPEELPLPHFIDLQA